MPEHELITVGECWLSVCRCGYGRKVVPVLVNVPVCLVDDLWQQLLEAHVESYV